MREHSTRFVHGDEMFVLPNDRWLLINASGREFLIAGRIFLESSIIKSNNFHEITAMHALRSFGSQAIFFNFALTE